MLNFGDSKPRVINSVISHNKFQPLISFPAKYPFQISDCVMLGGNKTIHVYGIHASYVLP